MYLSNETILTSSRNYTNLLRSSTPTTLSVEVPCNNKDTAKTTVNSSHSMPNVSDDQVNGNNRDHLHKVHYQNSKHGIDVSIEDVSDTKNGLEQSSRVSSYKTQTKGNAGNQHKAKFWYNSALLGMYFVFFNSIFVNRF